MEEWTKASKALDPLRNQMSELEQRLNKMTKGDFYGEFAARGLETMTVDELKPILRKHPQIYPLLRKAVKLHWKFYVQMNATQNHVYDVEEALKGDRQMGGSMKKIRQQMKWLRIRE